MNDYKSDPDTDYMKVDREVNRFTLPAERGGPVRSGLNSTSRAGVPADHSERSDQSNQANQRHRQEQSRERRPWGPCGACGASGHDAHFCRRRCKFCKQVHDAGRCEFFSSLKMLTKFVKSSNYRTTVPEELQQIYSPGNLN